MASIETGAAKPEELDDMLAIMCEAFDLPAAPARNVFFNDPYYNLNNKRLLRVDGQVVSCLTIVEMRFWIGETIVPVAGIAGVATLAARQRKGYAARLLTDTLEELARRGYPLSGLVPFSYDYYRPFGWELAGEAVHCQVAPSHLFAFPESAFVRSAVAADIPRLSALYEARAKGQSLYAVRDAKRWKYLLDNIRYCRVAQLPGQEVQGYLLYELRARPLLASDGQGGAARPPYIRVIEILSATPEARRALLGYLAGHTGIAHIEYTTSRDDLTASGLMETLRFEADVEPVAKIDLVPTLMIHVLDFAGVLKALSPQWPRFAGMLQAEMTDATEGGVQRVRLEGSVEGALISACDSRQAEEPVADVLEASRGTWAQLVVGFRSAEDAFALGILKASSDRARALAALLFPQRHPFLPAADHF